MCMVRYQNASSVRGGCTMGAMVHEHVSVMCAWEKQVSDDMQLCIN